MSMMQPEQAGPPPSIDVSGAGGDGLGAPHGPDRGDHSDALNDAIAAIEEFISDETDEQDIALAREIMAKLAKLRSSQQELVDKATGAGPGARLLRKSSGGGAPLGGGGGEEY
jgi:hypothetical protein